MKNDNTFAQTNAFAMQHGLWLGLMGIAAWAMWLWSFSMPAASLLFWLLMLGSWAGVVWLTWKFRKQMLTERPTFSFGRGFAHAFLTSTYAALWVAVAVFVYLAFFDHGYVFDQYEQFLKSPDMQQALQQSGMQARLDAMTEGKGTDVLVDALRAISPANYAGMIIYLNFIFGTVLSLVAALVCQKSKP